MQSRTVPSPVPPHLSPYPSLNVHSVVLMSSFPSLWWAQLFPLSPWQSTTRKQLPRQPHFLFSRGAMEIKKEGTEEVNAFLLCSPRPQTHREIPVNASLPSRPRKLPFAAVDSPLISTRSHHLSLQAVVGGRGGGGRRDWPIKTGCLLSGHRLNYKKKGQTRGALNVTQTKGSSLSPGELPCRSYLSAMLNHLTFIHSRSPGTWQLALFHFFPLSRG